jgi:hypothetical protein
MNNIGKQRLWRLAVGVVLLFNGPVGALAGDGPHMDLPAWDQTIPAAKRFVVLSNFDNQAVLDRETGLVWEKSPDTTMHAWPGSDVAIACANKAVGGRKGWRLPSIHEIASLIDPSVAAPGPTLPAGHPFMNVQSATYWSATTVAALPTNGWLLTFASGDVNSNPKETMQHVWCVRGGGLLDNY